MKNPTSVIIADAHYLVRVGLKNIFMRKPEYRILGEVENEVKLIAALEKKQPNILIIDPFQTDKFSIDTLVKVNERYPDVNFLIITGERTKELIYRVLEFSEVKCFLTKECDEREIADGIEAVAVGENPFFCKKIINLIYQKSFGKKEEKDCAGIPLSPREIQILKFVVAGKITKEIAADLGLSAHTVYTHRKNIMRKLKLSSTPELVLYAVNHGLVKAG